MNAKKTETKTSPETNKAINKKCTKNRKTKISKNRKAHDHDNFKKISASTCSIFKKNIFMLYLAFS